MFESIDAKLLKNIELPRDDKREISAEENCGARDQVVKVQLFRSTTETEVSKICEGTFALLESHLVPSVSFVESKILYLKMKGDYFRYLVEFKTEVDRKEAAGSTLLAYKSAQKLENK